MDVKSIERPGRGGMVEMWSSTTSEGFEVYARNSCDVTNEQGKGRGLSSAGRVILAVRSTGM